MPNSSGSTEPRPRTLAAQGALRRRLGLTALLMAGVGRLPAWAASTADDTAPEDSPRWQQVRRGLFGDQPIATAAGGPIELEAPPRAEDAAIVPVAVRARWPQEPNRHVRRVVLVIDNDPSPIAAFFRFTVASGRADIETRVRIDEYTFVRAIAEMNDGRLFMSARHVKASGGCSAPPGKDHEAALATLGQMRLRVLAAAPAAGCQPAQLMIRHPNDSGLAMDPLTRHYLPAQFVRSVSIRHRGNEVLAADLDIAISENPNLRFCFVPDPEGGELRADVVDSQDRRFATAIEVAARP